MSYLKELIKGTAALPFRGRAASKERALRQDLARFGKMLHTQGFVAATDGNLSVRLDQERILVTPTCFSKGMMTPDDMVIVDLHGKKLCGFYNPSSEIVMHLTIYRTRPDVGAVVHAHPCTATGFASAGIALDEPLCSEIVITLGAVPLAPYATTGTMELRVEHYAKIVMAARQLGCARTLDSRELEKLFAVRSQYAKNGH